MSVPSERQEWLERRVAAMTVRERELTQRLRRLAAEAELAKAELAMWKVEHEEDKSWLQAKVQRQRAELLRLTSVEDGES